MRPDQTCEPPSMPPFVRALTHADSAAFADLSALEPVRTLPIRMNVEAFGFDGATVLLWGVFAPDGARLAGVLLRFSNIAIAVDHDGCCAPSFAALIDSLPGIAGVRGPVDTVSGIQSALRKYTPIEWEDSTLMRLLVPPVVDPGSLGRVRRAVSADLDALVSLYGSAGVMYRSRANVAAKLAEPRVFVAAEPALGRRPARIASCALLNVEGADAGLIGGVYTLPEARGKGYAAACTAALSIDLQRDGKLPCLFYENPVAGRVYHRLGFEECGKWAVLYLSPTTRRT